MLGFALSSGLSPQELNAYDVPLRGSLEERANQAGCLVLQGILVAKFAEGGAVRSADLQDVLAALWSNRPDGWTFYGDEMVRRKICTRVEFSAQSKDVG